MKKGSFAVLLFVLILLSQRGSVAQDASLQAVGDPELPRVFLGHDTALDPGVEIASLRDQVGQRLLHVIVDGGRPLRFVIRLSSMRCVAAAA